MKKIVKLIHDYRIWGAYSLFTGFVALAIPFGLYNKVTVVITAILWLVMCIWAFVIGHHLSSLDNKSE